MLCIKTDPVYAVESHPGINLESMYSEAVIAYNKKQSDQALKLLNELLVASPNHVEGLELMALTLKEKGDPTKAMEVYARLIKAKPEAARGPYYFEMGMMYHKANKPDLAKPYFEKALKLGFNRSTTQLFLGLISFTAGRLNESEKSFTEVKSGGAPEMKLLAHYYLGLIHFKNGYGAGGTYELTAARNLARDLPNSKMTTDIAAGADKILAPFNKDQWFGNMTFLTEYDSNIATLPTSAAAANASKKSTPNLMLNGGAGYMTSPTNTVQWVGNYRFSVNKTTNVQTKSYEYFNHTPALFMNISPLSRTTGGLKVEGNLAFNNMPKDPEQPNGAYIFRKYSTYFEGSPYFRYELAKGVQSELEAGYRKITNDSDPTQSGNLLRVRGSTHATTSSQLLNPGASVSYEKLNTLGIDTRSNSLDFGLFNTMKLSGSDILNLSVDYTLSRYPLSTTSRSDKTTVARLSAVHTLSPAFSLLGEVNYTANSSSLADAYSYNRLAVGFGMGWTL
ncbi:MAG: hypothetical protein A2070_14415 [Bdellovibrionales bacterium GWC1_52_8]|nr:MAG: hypothetical protein A2Z97_09420 [Bdellovibrionales bacterium GWB1_52_6]OFZ34929.1 MAG: hypothetical protein A2070_14415 [Bdellovibrionales bacterium GWC1_52_8]